MIAGQYNEPLLYKRVKTNMFFIHIEGVDEVDGVIGNGMGMELCSTCIVHALGG